MKWFKVHFQIVDNGGWFHVLVSAKAIGDVPGRFLEEYTRAYPALSECAAFRIEEVTNV